MCVVPSLSMLFQHYRSSRLMKLQFDFGWLIFNNLCSLQQSIRSECALPEIVHFFLFQSQFYPGLSAILKFNALMRIEIVWI